MSALLPTRRLNTESSSAAQQRHAVLTKRIRKAPMTDKNPFFKNTTTRIPQFVPLAPTDKGIDTMDLADSGIERNVKKCILLQNKKVYTVSFKDEKTGRCLSDPQLSKSLSQETQYSDKSKTLDSNQTSRDSSVESFTLKKTEDWNKSNQHQEENSMDSQDETMSSAAEDSCSLIFENKKEYKPYHNILLNTRSKPRTRRWSHMPLSDYSHPVVHMKDYQRSISSCVE